MNSFITFLHKSSRPVWSCVRRIIPNRGRCLKTLDTAIDYF